MSDKAICCPKCEWEPKKRSKWYCTCGYSWNTFDTGGTCPSCKKQWQTTQCHDCHQFSTHLEWYKHLDTKIREELLSLTKLILH